MCQKGKISKNCFICQKEIINWPSQFKNIENPTCSKECLAKLRSIYINNLGLYCDKCHKIIEKNTRLFWTKEFFDKTNIIETLPHIKDKENSFHCYSICK